MTDASRWTLRDWLQAGANLAIILWAIVGALLLLSNARASAVADNRQSIVRAWTNEGDMLSSETRFIELRLSDYDGDIIGTLTSPGLNQPLDVSAEIGWFSSTLKITELRGRSVSPVATVQVTVGGNNNRLQWQVESSDEPDYLPVTTTLWPTP